MKERREQDAKERVDEAKRQMKQEVMARKRLALDSFFLIVYSWALGGIQEGTEEEGEKRRGEDGGRGGRQRGGADDWNVSSAGLSLCSAAYHDASYGSPSLCAVSGC